MERDFIFNLKDLDRHITSYMDDRDILNLLLLNKKYASLLNENFFENLVKRKYPFLVKFKKEEEKWKRFYIKMIYYINKLKEDFQISYSPTEEFSQKFSPEEIYKMRNNNFFRLMKSSSKSHFRQFPY
jgi:hypothetical protein